MIFEKMWPIAMCEFISCLRKSLMSFPILIVDDDAIPKFSAFLGFSALSILSAVAVAFWFFLFRTAIIALMCG